MLKRAFDLVMSFLGLVMLSPLFLVAGALVKLEDGGPIFFRQVRTGLNGIPFRMWKFRSMVVDADRQGKSITVGQDRRITRIGHCLRKSKVDELPQLLNVFWGDMSFVGPRPEVARYTDLYTPEQKRVLAIKPGVTDPASIKYRDESSLLAEAKDPEAFYIHEVMPDKIQINLDYKARATFWSDLLVILQTLGLVRRP